MAYFAATAFLPLLVITRFGAAANAYFYVAWTTSVALGLLAINMSMSLTVEGSLSRGDLTAHVRVAAQRIARLLLPLVVVAVAFTPQLLSVFGASYARQSSGLFRLMVLAVLPKAVIELYLGVVRVQGGSHRIALVVGMQAGLFVTLVFILIGPAGLTGIGWALLVSNAVVAAPLLWRLRAALAREQPRPASVLVTSGDRSRLDGPSHEGGQRPPAGTG
jgi:O-antigen/teichoic acid export membrane protein